MITQPSSSSSSSSSSHNNMKIFVSSFLPFTLAFSLAESALVTSVSLCSRLFGSSGSRAVSILYLMYACGTLLSPHVVSGGGGDIRTNRQRLRPALVGGQVGLVAFHVGCVIQTTRSSDNDGSGGVVLISSAVVAGIAAGIAWSTAGAFITKTAVIMSKLGDDEEEEEEILLQVNRDDNNNDNTFSRLERILINLRMNNNNNVFCCLSREFHHLAGNLTSIFNVVMLMTILCGHLWSYYSLGDGSMKEMQSTYSFILMAGIIAAVIMYLNVNDPESTTETTTTITNDNVAYDERQRQQQRHHCNNNNNDLVNPQPLLFLFYPLQITLQTPSLSHLIPTHVSCGFMEALITCYVNVHLIPQASWIGWLSAIKTIMTALSSPVFAHVGNFSRRGRYGVLLIGAGCYLIVVGLIMVLIMMIRLNGDSSTVDDDGTNGSYHHWVTLVAIYSYAGIAYSTWQGTAGGALISEITATSSFRDENNLTNNDDVTVTAAFSGCKVVNGLSTSLAFWLFGRKEGLMSDGMILGLLCVVMVVVGVYPIVRLWIRCNNGDEEGGYGYCNGDGDCGNEGDDRGMMMAERKDDYGSVPYDSKRVDNI